MLGGILLTGNKSRKTLIVSFENFFILFLFRRYMKRDSNLTASDKFVMILAIVSIIGFIEIVSYTLFDFSLRNYVEPFWMITIGIGFILEGQVKTLKRLREEGLNPTNFTHLTTLIIGVIAIITGILSFPQINVVSTGFLAVKGILSLLAIVIIVVQTWIVK